MRSALLGCGIAATLALSWDTGAEVPKAECVKANAEAQALRLNGKLAAARERLAFCQDPSCPGMVRDDCTQRMDELDRVEPTIVFEVKDSHGSDLSTVSVTMDGQPLASKLAGTALKVDPGEHAFTFSAEGQTTQTRTFVIHEGEKDRRERIAFTGAAPAAGVPDGSAGSTGGLGTRKIVALTAGGVGIASIAVGTVFGILSLSAASSQKTDCASSASCTDRSAALSDHGTAVTDGAVSTVAILAGGALLVTGVTLFFTGRSSAEHPAGGFWVTPNVRPGSASLSLQWKL
jgi:hypothetical protein